MKKVLFDDIQLEFFDNLTFFGIFVAYTKSKKLHNTNSFLEQMTSEFWPSLNKFLHINYKIGNKYANGNESSFPLQPSISRFF